VIVYPSGRIFRMRRPMQSMAAGWRGRSGKVVYESLEMADAGVTSELVFFLYRDLATGAVEESHVNTAAGTKTSVS